MLEYLHLYPVDFLIVMYFSLFVFVQQQQILPPPRQMTTEEKSDVNMEEEEDKDGHPEGESTEGVTRAEDEQEESEIKMEQESSVEEEHAKMPEHPGRDSDSGDSEEDEP